MPFLRDAEKFSRYRRELGVLLILALAAAGCSSSKPSLDYLVREQAVTLESLQKEIKRLNLELEETIHAREDLARAKEDLEKKMQTELQAGGVSLALDKRGLVVTLLSQILFDSGRTDLREDFLPSLDKVANVLKERVADHMIYVEGHTDNEPIYYSSWKSNWELSTARATEVIHYFEDTQGIRPERLAAVGYGEFHPVAGNETDEGRRQNRRVEIVISPLKLTTGNSDSQS